MAAQLDPLCALLDEATFLGASSSGGLSVALVGLASRHLSLPRTLERCPVRPGSRAGLSLGRGLPLAAPGAAPLPSPCTALAGRAPGGSAGPKIGKATPQSAESASNKSRPTTSTGTGYPSTHPGYGLRVRIVTPPCIVQPPPPHCVALSPCNRVTLTPALSPPVLSPPLRLTVTSQGCHRRGDSPGVQPLGNGAHLEEVGALHFVPEVSEP
eukprot:1195384-Prorocentrum_minimum.AAC.4